VPTQFEDFELRIESSPEGNSAPAPTGPAVGLGAAPRGDERTVTAYREVATQARWRPTYPVRATSSQGESSGLFRFPFRDDEALRLVTQGPRLDEGALDDLGVRLFRAAFADQVGTLFVLTNREATRANRGLRLRLLLEAAELAELPWEIVRPPDWSFAPALSERAPIVRQIDLLGEHRGLDVDGPLDVLLVAAQPTDQNPLALEREKQNIRQILEPLERGGKVRVTDLGRARKPAVLDALRQGRHHVLHFMMHADYDPGRERGALLLEDEAGRSALLEAEEFAVALFTNPQTVTRLVIFNACRSANDSAIRPGRGLAAAAVRLNLPAVVAMQFPISDPAAIEFAREFYVRLVQGQGVDEAIARARYAIRFNTPDATRDEWIIPVLYLRSKEMRLFRGTSVNYLDYTPDAGPAKELIRQVDDAPRTDTGAARAPEVLLRVGRSDPRNDGRFDVTLATPHGSAQGVLELTADFLAPMKPPNEAWQEQDERVPRDPEQLKAMGENLFARLFTGQLATQLRVAQDQARAHGAGLRVSLVADDPVMDLVPWEFLRDPYRKKFLTLEGETGPFLRRIDPPGGPAPAGPGPITGPLRVLFVACNPRDLPLLNLDREWNWLQEAVRDAGPGRVEVGRLVDPTREKLLQALGDGAYHVFHFAGYDSFCISLGSQEEGFVLLDENGQKDYCPYDQLTDLLGGISSLRLVVTNTCYTAARLAPTLVRAGIPAVLAMRFGIRDDFAVRFTLLFYRALFKLKLDVAAALAAARKTLQVTMDREPHCFGNWTYPTLVTSVAGAAVFGPTA
jgi:CHAT domain-containing protein